MAGPRKPQERRIRREADGDRRGGALPGDFLSPELEADTARFLDDVKERIRRRSQVRPPSLGEPPRDEP